MIKIFWTSGIFKSHHNSTTKQKNCNNEVVRVSLLFYLYQHIIQKSKMLITFLQYLYPSWSLRRIKQKDIIDKLEGARTRNFFCSNFVVTATFCKEISVRKLINVVTNHVKDITEIFDSNQLISFNLRNINK